MARELASMGLENLEIEAGGVAFSATLEDAAVIASSARTPSRVLLRVTEGPAHSLAALADLVRRADWSPFFLGLPGDLDVSVSATRSRLHHRDTVARKVEHALRDATRTTARPREVPPQRLSVRLDHDVARISVDVGGDLLHLRGWRKDAGKAPLRENLAAALLFMAGWQGDEPLVDPFCGAGTIPIEAALLRSGRPPFVGRSFAWQGWPALGALRLPSPTPAGLAGPPILGADKESRAIAGAVENAQRAGVTIDWRVCDVAELEAPAATGLVVTNPPYGRRLGEHVEGVYHAFGRTLRERFAGWRALFLAPDARLASRVHRDAERLTTFENGGFRVGAWAVEL